MQEQWTVSDSNELYGVAQWGRNLFSINPQGRLVVHPTGQPESFIDLKSLVDEIEARGIGAPMLIRFPDILKQRMVELNECFRAAITEQNYKGEYRGVFPIKVNQERQVVQSIVEFGKPYHFGLEAGSKPELMTTLALLDSNEALIVCNGYKDEEYIELALLATKLGRKVVIVLEKLSELDPRARPRPACLRSRRRAGPCRASRTPPGPPGGPGSRSRPGQSRRVTARPAR